MEKLQLMMFEAIGYKLKFSQKVTERYLDVLGVRFGKNSEMEQLMKRLLTGKSQKRHRVLLLVWREKNLLPQVAVTVRL